MGWVVLCLISANAFAGAGPATDDVILGSRWVSARGAALGGAYLGQVEDVGESLFYNPAGLAKRDGLKGEPFNMIGGMNMDLVKQVDPAMTKFTSLSSYGSDRLQKFPGTDPMIQGGFMTAFGYGGFGFGLVSQAKLIASFDGTNYRYRSKYQLIPAAGFGWRLASGVLRMGYSLQWVNQSSGDVTVLPSSPNVGYNQGLGQGAGISHTLGMTLTLPYTNQPMISVVGRNIGGLRMNNDGIVKFGVNPVGRPTKEDMSVDTGLNWMTKLGGKWSTTWSLAYRDLFNVAGISPVAHASAGFELSAGDRVFVRLGFASAYPAVGFGLKAKNASLDFAVYGEELGGGLRSESTSNVMFNFKLRF